MQRQRGSIRKRGATYTAYWTVPRISPETGRVTHQQRTRGGFDTKAAAQEHLNQTLVDLGQGTYSEPSKMAVATFLTSVFLPAIRNDVRPLSHLRYTKIVGTYIAPSEIGALPLCALTTGHIAGFYSSDNVARLSPATRRLIHAVLRRALGYAHETKMIPSNPTPKGPPEPEADVTPWSPSELHRFLKYVADDRLAAMWRLSAMTGMRRGEVLGLTWRHVGLDAAKLNVQQQLIPTPGGCTIGPPKSAKGKRTISLDPETVLQLRRHRDTQLLEQSVAGAEYNHHADLVFASETGDAIHPQRMTERFASLRKAAGIPSGRLHVLRHTHVTISLAGDPDAVPPVPPVPLHIVARRLGDRPEQMLKTYARFLPNSDETAAAAFASIIAAVH
jgi:integrase